MRLLLVQQSDGIHKFFFFEGVWSFFILIRTLSYLCYLPAGGWSMSAFERTGRCESTRVTCCVCVTATLCLHSVPLPLQSCRQVWSSLPRKRHCSSWFLMQLSPETKPHTSTRDAVPESLQFRALCAWALGGMSAPGTTGCACKFLFK